MRTDSHPVHGNDCPDLNYSFHSEVEVGFQPTLGDNDRKAWTQVTHNQLCVVNSDYALPSKLQGPAGPSDV